MGNDLALAIVRWQRNRNQGLSSLTAVRDRQCSLGSREYPDDRWYIDDRVPYAGNSER
jgi:hypothetical protein